MMLLLLKSILFITAALAIFVIIQSHQIGRIANINAFVPKKSAVVQSHSPSRPLPLSYYMDSRTKQIKNDVQWLLHFAVIGFGKCGTSSVMHWLAAATDELQVLPREAWALVKNRPDRLVAILYNQLDDPHKKRGVKNPGDIHQRHALAYYRTLWPKTKLIVGVRHPVLWMQSLYNFRIQSKGYMLHANKLIGGCKAGNNLVCTTKGDFAHSLIQLGKQHWNGTRQSTELERMILNGKHRETPIDSKAIMYMPNDVFLYEVGQLGDDDKERLQLFRNDMQNFLGLRATLSKLGHVVPGKILDNQTQSLRDSLKINICDDQYIPLRYDLMHSARLGSRWIRETFLKLPGVYASSIQHLESLLEAWMIDPCGPKLDSLSQEEIARIYEDTKVLHA
jgi:hypothetical protein